MFKVQETQQNHTFILRGWVFQDKEIFHSNQMKTYLDYSCSNCPWPGHCITCNIKFSIIPSFPEEQSENTSVKVLGELEALSKCSAAAVGDGWCPLYHSWGSNTSSPAGAFSTEQTVHLALALNEKHTEPFQLLYFLPSPSETKARPFKCFLWSLYWSAGFQVQPGPRT